MIEIYSISLLLVCSYIVLLTRYCLAWIRIPEHNSDAITKSGITILIPCRNEEENLISCLQAIANQDFPKDQFEVIVVDDHSEDKTVDISNQYFANHPELCGQVLSLNNKSSTGKKEAITKGMEAAKHPLVITTDADCVSPKTWLKSIVTFYEAHGGKLIAAPVVLVGNPSLGQQLQDLEFIGLQTVAAAGIEMNEPVLCNGANLCYEREAFFKVGGYQNDANIPSGDDLFIMQKINKEFPGEVKFIKSKGATVQSNASSSVNQFFGQRKRWVSKVISIPDWRTIMVAFIVYLANLTLVINFLFWMFLPDFSGSFLIITFAAKALIDLVFLHLAASFFERQNLMKIFILAEFLNVLYVSIIGVFGNIGGYTWKGRTSQRGFFVSNNG